jgi:NitT/TauT family transport system substrate-binding protein
MVGYVFDEGWARTHAQALTRFLAATHAAKEILATSDAEWERIAPLTGVRDPQALAVYRDRYREGIPRRPIAEEEADARVLYRILAQQGGAALVGPATELAPGTFFSPPPAGE